MSAAKWPSARPPISSSANGSEVWTPPLSSGCLPGITREVLLSEIHSPGIRIVEKTLKPADLETADEVFITSTTRDLLPVMQIEGKKIGRTDDTRPSAGGGVRGIRGAIRGRPQRQWCGEAKGLSLAVRRLGTDTRRKAPSQKENGSK